MSLSEEALVYFRLCELACFLERPENLSELRRLGAIYRREYSCLPAWVRDEAGLQESGMKPVTVPDRAME